MPYRLLHIDFAHITLNVISGSALAVDLLTDALSSTGGILLTLSIVLLNVSKAVVNFRKGRRPIDVCDLEDENKDEKK